MILSFQMKGDVYLTISWCYGSKKIIWKQSVLGHADFPNWCIGNSIDVTLAHVDEDELFLKAAVDIKVDVKESLVAIALWQLTAWTQLQVLASFEYYPYLQCDEVCICICKQNDTKTHQQEFPGKK